VQPVARILDANANRAREAMRVMEDIARFAVDDAVLVTELKGLRHELAHALTRLPEGWLEVNRDVAGDVGTDVTAAGERERAGLIGVATAAGKRLGEALRVIEETAKTIDSTLSERVEALRYRAYDAERTLLERLAGGRARQWRVCVLLTERLCTRPWSDVLRAAIDGGADCVQVREKQMQGGDLRDRVEQVIAIARPSGVSVIVNDRIDVALAVAADGVHLGTGDLPLADARRLAGRTLLIGASTHGPDEASAAVDAGADYCGVGKMFETATKSRTATTGPSVLAAFVRAYPRMPHLAIGGVTPENIGQLVEAGVQGVAVSRAICAAEHPDRVVAALRDALSYCDHARVR